jgi:Zn-dependent metalloprotease
LSLTEARDRVAALSGADPRAIDGPELVVLPLPAGGFALTYRAQAWSGSALTMYFLDGATGEVVWLYDNLQTQAAVRLGKGVLNDEKKVSMRANGSRFVADDLLRPPRIRTYDMLGNLPRAKQVLAGTAVLSDADLASETASTWTDGASVDAHVYAGWTYDYFFKRFGRRGLDDRDGPITLMVHPAESRHRAQRAGADVGTYYLNATWNSGRASRCSGKASRQR